MPLPLVERSRQEIAGSIRSKVEKMKGVEEVRQLDVRISGKRLDINLVLLVADNLEWEDTHKISLDVEREVKQDFPSGRVTVSTETVGKNVASVWKLVKDIADATPGSRGVHNIHIQSIEGLLDVDLHLEVSANLTVMQAHEIADRIEKNVKAANSDISEVTIHIESASERVSREMAGFETELESYVTHVAEGFPEIKNVQAVKIRRVGGDVHLVLQCRFDANLSIEKAHEISNRLEKALKTTYQNITRIDVHEEPA